MGAMCVLGGEGFKWVGEGLDLDLSGMGGFEFKSCMKRRTLHCLLFFNLL
ncbi:hypothetical protein DFR44_1192 [Hydromonas duriensis]|uniref:Uncharacterized protein n=1 Tax=Hydromonas duriensis TaxID=1527608 RepID=A0A4R6Y5A7_9BURK|nr:hypothetical protein DFR44_1192 [Hydromonas duriensis]